MSRSKNPIIVALDHEDPAVILQWAKELGPYCGYLKVGLEAFTLGGPDLVRKVGEYAPVFLDLKLHDIPNTVAGAVRACDQLNVGLLTIHASGGAAMIQAAVAAATNTKIIAVSVLTSNDNETMEDIGQLPVENQVPKLAKLALVNGADGIVCAPSDLPAVRANVSAQPLFIVPGVRPAGSPSNDQKRVATPQLALRVGATHLVIGRPITRADNPTVALQKLLESIHESV